MHKNKQFCFVLLMFHMTAVKVTAGIPFFFFYSVLADRAPACPALQVGECCLHAGNVFVSVHKDLKSVLPCDFCINGPDGLSPRFAFGTDGSKTVQYDYNWTSQIVHNLFCDSSRPSLFFNWHIFPLEWIWFWIVPWHRQNGRHHNTSIIICKIITLSTVIRKNCLSQIN